jgi:hypothetical protein
MIWAYIELTLDLLVITFLVGSVIVGLYLALSKRKDIF